jgi:protein-S-isoprenylcysteine O-methyltransferase Ste14
MNAVPLGLVLLNFMLIGLLPILFFRRGGRLNPRWWLTAAPFFVVPVFVLAAAAGLAAPLTHGLELAAIPLAAASIALIATTVRAHRVRIALWHQSDDAPQELVTWGPYRWMRHPFYGAFLLALLGAAALCPHLVTSVALGWAIATLNLTAAREERRLCASPPPVGASYAAYMRRVGRFTPRLRRA